MIAYLALVGIGFVIAAVVGTAQAEVPEERERTDAVRRLDHLRF
jgi:hypothetical protein